MSPVVAVRSSELAETLPLSVRLLLAVASSLPLAVTSPSTRLFLSTIDTWAPFRDTAPPKSLPELVSVMFAGTTGLMPVEAAKLLVPDAVTAVPVACVIAPFVLVTLKLPELLRLPNCTPPLVSVMLVMPVTPMLPVVPWLKPLVTVRLPPALSVPPVCVSVPVVMAPVPAKLPPDCVQLSNVVVPALVKMPPLCV